MLEEKVYRGTWTEIAAHQSELPPDAVFELRVVALNQEAEEQSLHERFGHLFGTVSGGPSDVAEHPDTYTSDFGVTKTLRP